MIKQILMDFMKIINNKRNELIGAILGFIVGVMILTIGFLKTLFIFICTTVGYVLGSGPQNKARIKKWLERNLPPGGIG